MITPADLFRLATIPLTVCTLLGTPQLSAQEGQCEENCEDPTTSPPPAWPVIYSDFRNLRGVNFIPAYGSLAAYKPDTQAFPLFPGFRGVASPTAMWFWLNFIQADSPSSLPPGSTLHPSSTNPWDDINDQLGYLKGAGINTVRIWLSYPLWLFYHKNPTAYKGSLGANQFIQNLDLFKVYCDANKMRVIPILWGMVSKTDIPVDPPTQALPAFSGDPAQFQGQHEAGWSPDPDLSFITTAPIAELDPLTGLLTTARFNPILAQDWHNNPGNAIIQNPAAYPDPNATPGTDNWLYAQYIIECVQVFDGHPSLLMWEAINEPETQPNKNDDGTFDWSARTLALIKANDPDAVTTNGLVTFNPESQVNGTPIFSSILDYARDPNLDVLGSHPYTQTRIRPIVEIDGMIRNFDAIQGFPSTTVKPLILSEFAANYYDDAINYASNIDRPDIPGDVKGIGFILFQGITGLRGSKHPFKGVSGIFHADGTVRDLATVIALKNLALTDPHVDPATLSSSFVAGDFNSTFGWPYSIYQKDVGGVLVDQVPSLQSLRLTLDEDPESIISNVNPNVPDNDVDRGLLRLANAYASIMFYAEATRTLTPKSITDYPDNGYSALRWAEAKRISERSIFLLRGVLPESGIVPLQILGEDVIPFLPPSPLDASAMIDGQCPIDGTYLVDPTNGTWDVFPVKPVLAGPPPPAIPYALNYVAYVKQLEEWRKICNWFIDDISGPIGRYP